MAATTGVLRAPDGGVAPIPVPDRRIGEIAKKTVESGASPGIAIVVWRSGALVVAVYEGFSNLETRSRVVAESVFDIGSLTKQFTAIALARLAAKGALSLEDPAHKHLPFLAKHEAFSIAELLHHTAGVHDGDYLLPEGSPRTQTAIAESISEQTAFFDFPPGSAWRYSNANYILAGAIIEQATKQPLANAFDELVFKPAGLARTALDDRRDVVERRVSGYSPVEGGVEKYRNAEYIDIFQTGGAGAMRSTANDLCRWHQALFAGKFDAGQSSELATRPGRLRDGRLSSANRFDPADRPMGETGYGFGLHLDRTTVDGSLIAHHNGFISGFSAYLATHPATRSTVACLCNIDPHPQLPFRDLRKAVFGRLLLPV